MCEVVLLWPLLELVHKGPKSLEVNSCDLSYRERGSWHLLLHTRSQVLLSLEYDVDAYMATLFRGEAWDLCWELRLRKCFCIKCPRSNFNDNYIYYNGFLRLKSWDFASMLGLANISEISNLGPHMNLPWNLNWFECISIHVGLWNIHGQVLRLKWDLSLRSWNIAIVSGSEHEKPFGSLDYNKWKGCMRYTCFTPIYIYLASANLWEICESLMKTRMIP